MTTGCRYSNSVMVSLNSRKSHNTVESATTDYESYSMRFQTRNTYQETTFGAVRFFVQYSAQLPLVLIGISAGRM